MGNASFWALDAAIPLVGAAAIFAFRPSLKRALFGKKPDFAQADLAMQSSG